MPQGLRRLFKSLLLACALSGCLLPAPAALGRQEPARPEAAAPPDDEEEPTRIETELIQTGAMVFDKQGRFVEGLRQDDFELSVEGGARPSSFFDRVATAPQPSSPSGRAGASSRTRTTCARTSSGRWRSGVADATRR